MAAPSKPKKGAGRAEPRQDPKAAGAATAGRDQGNQSAGLARQPARRIQGMRLHNLVQALWSEVREASAILQREGPETSDFLISSVAFELSFVVVAAAPEGVQVELAAEALHEVTADKLQKMRFTLVDPDSPAGYEPSGDVTSSRTRP